MLLTCFCVMRRQTDLISVTSKKPACWWFLLESRVEQQRWVGFEGEGDLRAAEWQERLSLASNIYSIKGRFGTSLTSGVNISLPVTSAHFRFHSQPLLSLSFQKSMAFFVKRLACALIHTCLSFTGMPIWCLLLTQIFSFFFSLLIRVFSPGFYFPFISFKFTPDSNLKSGFSVLNQTYGMLL